MENNNLIYKNLNYKSEISHLFPELAEVLKPLEKPETHKKQVFAKCRQFLYQKGFEPDCYDIKVKKVLNSSNVTYFVIDIANKQEKIMKTFFKENQDLKNSVKKLELQNFHMLSQLKKQKVNKKKYEFYDEKFKNNLEHINRTINFLFDIGNYSVGKEILEIKPTNKKDWDNKLTDLFNKVQAEKSIHFNIDTSLIKPNKISGNYNSLTWKSEFNSVDEAIFYFVEGNGSCDCNLIRFYFQNEDLQKEFEIHHPTNCKTENFEVVEIQDKNQNYKTIWKKEN